MRDILSDLLYYLIHYLLNKTRCSHDIISLYHSMKISDLRLSKPTQFGAYTLFSLIVLEFEVLKCLLNFLHNR